MGFKVQTRQEVMDSIVANVLASFARADHVHNNIPTALPDIDVDVQAFRDEFNSFKERTPPDCHCDIKRLVSYGHENGCGYMAWKARKAQS